MIIQTLKSALIALGIGVIVHLLQGWMNSDFLTNFLQDNLVTLLVALLAINSATMGIVLTKVRDLIDSKGNGSCFASTKKQMLHSVREQIALVGVGILLLVISGSHIVPDVPNLPLLIESAIIGVFVYALMILYDTARGVLIIIDFDPNS